MSNRSRLQTGKSRWLWRALQLMLIAIPLWLVLANLQRNWQELGSFSWRLSLPSIIPALLVLTAAFALLPLAGKQALAATGIEISYLQSYWAYYITQLSKYLPGGFWIFPGRAVALQRYNVGLAASSAAMVLELSVLVLAAVSVFIPYALTVGSRAGTVKWHWMLLVVAPTLVLLHPRVFTGLLQRLLRAIGKPEMAVGLSFRRLGRIFAIDVCFWLVTGASFALLVRSLDPIPVRSLLALTPVFSMAWAIGFLAFLAPSGLGVREGAITLLLTPLLPAPLPALVALLARLWWTVAEVTSLGIALLVSRYFMREERAEIAAGP